MRPRVSEYILDASALLAMLNSEKGKEEIEKILPFSVMSTVNIAEVVGELHNKLALEIEECENIILTMVNRIVDFDIKQSMKCAELKKHTRQYGLSLGDRACMSLGLALNLPIYTADKIWAQLDIGCKIVLLR